MGVIAMEATRAARPREQTRRESPNSPHRRAPSKQRIPHTITLRTLHRLLLSSDPILRQSKLLPKLPQALRRSPRALRRKFSLLAVVLENMLLSAVLGSLRERTARRGSERRGLSRSKGDKEVGEGGGEVWRRESDEVLETNDENASDQRTRWGRGETHCLIRAST